MKIIEPKITLAALDDVTYNYYNAVVYSNVPTSTLNEWDSTKTDYAIEDSIYNPTLRRVYVCGVAGSTATPWLSSEWKDAGAENNMLMHDQTLFTKTESNADIEVHYETLYETYLTFFGMKNITSIEVEQRTLDTDELIKTETIELRDYGVDIFVEYCYTETVDKENYAVEIEGDRPSLVKVRFIGTETRSIGASILGNATDYGCVYTGATVQGENLSKFVDNGLVTYFTEKGIVKRLKGSISVPSSRAESLSKKLDDLSGNLSVYWMNDDINMQDMGMVFGYSNGYSFPANNLSHKESPFEIIGVK